MRWIEKKTLWNRCVKMPKNNKKGSHQITIIMVKIVSLCAECNQEVFRNL